MANAPTTMDQGMVVGVLKAEPTPQGLQDRSWDERRENKEPWRKWEEEVWSSGPRLCDGLWVVSAHRGQ